MQIEFASQRFSFLAKRQKGRKLSQERSTQTNQQMQNKRRGRQNIEWCI